MIRAVEKLAAGITVGELKILARKTSRGRFAEETNLEVLVKRGFYDDYLLTVKVFHGRRPFARPWAEIFNINNLLSLDGEPLAFFGSSIEDSVMKVFADSLRGGESIFVEYFEDKETLDVLKEGLPAPLTRLGFKLFCLGFTWFKDWYFPEGFLEGGQKLQAEKPLDEEARARHLRMTSLEVRRALDGLSLPEADDEMLRSIQMRADIITSIAG